MEEHQEHPAAEAVVEHQAHPAVEVVEVAVVAQTTTASAQMTASRRLLKSHSPGQVKIHLTLKMPKKTFHAMMASQRESTGGR